MTKKSSNIKLDIDKMNFLEKIKTTKKENTYKVYSRLMAKLQKYENKIEKNFIYFDSSDIRLFFISLSSQPSIIRTYISILSCYYSFLQDNRIADIGINPLDNLKFQERLILISDNKYHYKYITYQELRIISGMLYNARDKAILLLSWLGLANDEILNLEIKDINFEERYLMINDRKVVFDEYIGDILKITEIEEEYFSKNGKCSYESTSKNKESIPKKLVKSPYLIKGVKNGKCTHNIIHNTFKIIRDFQRKDFNKSEEIGWKLFAKCNYITPTSISKSGLFTTLYDVEKEYRKEYADEFKKNKDKAEKKLKVFIQSQFKEVHVTDMFRDYKIFRDRDLKVE